MKKVDELRNPNSCLNKSNSDELVFVLREKDPLFAMTVRHWAAMASGIHEIEKINEAQAVANDAELNRQLRFPEPLPQAPRK